MEIWDVTNPLRPRQQQVAVDGAQQIARFGSEGNALKTFVIFNDQYLDPVISGAVANQNIHGQSIPNLVIITHPSLASEAERLAAFRRQHDNLTVNVVTIDQVYNEFSSGAPDITAIRDYAKYLYDQDLNNQFRYLLLFGDCSYDYKSQSLSNTNKIPTYQSRNSLWPTHNKFFQFI